MDTQLQGKLATINRVVEDDSKPAFKDMVREDRYEPKRPLVALEVVATSSSRVCL